MRNMRASQSQFEILLDFMERNGDLCTLPQSAQGRLENLQKWHELVELLNNNTEGQAKPLEKWRKAWSDFKNNTKKKIAKIRRHGGEGPELTEAEKRLLRLIGDKRGRKRRPQLEEESSIQYKDESDIDQSSLTPPPRYFCTVESRSSDQRNTSTSSCSSETNNPEPSEKKPKLETDPMKQITDSFLEFEKEREKMAHEREMARIKQNDQLLAVFGRMVNVIETLAPSIQKYLDRKIDDG